MKFTRTLRLVAALAIMGSLAAGLRADVSVDTVATNLFEPFGVASDADGTTYVTDGANQRIIKLAAGTTSGSILAGQTGVSGTNDGIVSAARFNLPQGIVLARGGLVVADSANHTLRFITLNGIVSTLAGAAGVPGSANGPASSARFRYPLGLATDAGGNIYIADSQNNAIRKLDTNNVVSTVISNLLQPAGMSIAANGAIWVADTRRHCIKVLDTNGVLSVVAGISGVSGANDSYVATDATFTLPRAVLWLSDSAGVLVSDSGNHTIRRIYYNTSYGTYSVETFAGTPGVAGAVNGPALSAQFNTPIGLSRDQLGGGFFVADKANNQLRRINTGAVQPPVADPQIGWTEVVWDPVNGYIILFHPVTSSTFNNDVLITIKSESGTTTYYTKGATPTSVFEDTIPNPGPGPDAQTPPMFTGREIQLPPRFVDPMPDLTIKAIGTQDGRRSSQTVQARFQFQTANPIINGDNAASFKVDDVTDGAELWYTWDGTDPSIGHGTLILSNDVPATISRQLNVSNATFRVRAFRSNFTPSDIVSKTFYASNFVANDISFGFASGEASSAFVAAAGQSFYAPVTLTLLPGQTIYTLQFDMFVTNGTGPAVDPTAVGFRSMLMKPLKDQPGVYVQIPAGMYDGGFRSLVLTNPAINLLTAGWIERQGGTNLYDTKSQDLITFSMAHDTMFSSGNGKVVVGGYSFLVPANAPDGATYNIRLDRPSATPDGLNQDVYIRVPTNGSLAGGPINGIKTVTVGSRMYIVGDVAPFRWFNAGDFGEGSLINNDVVQVFQSAAYGLNTPPAKSDLFDGMDSSDGSLTSYADGSNYSIDQVRNGDGILAVDDIYVTYRRSLDPSLKWYARYWSNGVRQVVEVPNTGTAAGPALAAAPTVQAKSLVTPAGTPVLSVVPDDVVAAAGATVQVPIRVHINGTWALQTALVNVSVEALDGAPAIASGVTLSSATLGTPTMSSSIAPNQAAAAWLGSTAALTGDAVLATLTFTVPAGAASSAAYRVRFDHFSASPNGITLFRVSSYAGLVTTADRSGSTAGDGIPDSWRLRWFGSATSPLSAAEADPDGDGRSNLLEYQAGTNPLDGISRLALSSSTSIGGVKLTFPTGFGRTYFLETAPTLTGPWSGLWTNFGNGTWREWTDTPSTGVQFYRVRAQ